MSPEITASEQLKLDNQLCFRLYAASRAITRLYRPALDELGITYPQYLVLLAMWQWDEEGCLSAKTLSELVDRLHLDSGTMTPLFRRMEQSGLVTRSVNPTDKRETFIQLTAKGRALKTQAQKVPEQLTCRFTSAATEAEQEIENYPALLGQLDSLLATLQKK